MSKYNSQFMLKKGLEKLGFVVGIDLRSHQDDGNE